MSWMDEEIIAGLRADAAELMLTIKRSDAGAAKARQRAEEFEQKANSARRRLDQIRMLGAMAQGQVPVPDRDQIFPTDDGLGLTLGPLRIAGLPAEPKPEDFHNLAEVMRSIYAAASGVARRADEAARALATEQEPNPLIAIESPADGKADEASEVAETVKVVKRTCNGCGNVVGDAIPVELEAERRGDPLPDVRGECPHCSGTAVPQAGPPDAADAVPQAGPPDLADVADVVAGRRVLDDLADADSAPVVAEIVPPTLTDMPVVEAGGVR